MSLVASEEVRLEGLQVGIQTARMDVDRQRVAHRRLTEGMDRVVGVRREGLVVEVEGEVAEATGTGTMTGGVTDRGAIRQAGAHHRGGEITVRREEVGGGARVTRATETGVEAEAGADDENLHL